MTGDSHGGTSSAWPAFAALVEGDRAKILGDFVRDLEAVDSPVARDQTALDRTLADAGQILTDVVESVRSGTVQVDQGYQLLGFDADDSPGVEFQPPVAIFFETAVASIIQRADAESRAACEIALRALNQSITSRLWAAAGTHTAQLLNRFRDAELSERRRIARELHEHVGNGLSVAHQQLDLFQVYLERDPAKAMDRAEQAHQAVVGSMDRLRAVLADMRLETPPDNLRKVLATYFESLTATGVGVRLRVNGDEGWMPSGVADETSLIICEAVRSAIAHRHPTMVLVSVDIRPDELRVVLDDDGGDLDPSQTAEPGGSGLSSVRERAALLGGAATVTSRPRQGTHVELVVPLPATR